MAADHGHETNLDLPEVAVAMGRHESQSPGAKASLIEVKWGGTATHASWMGKEIASGAYGTAYRAPASLDDLLALKRAMRYVTYRAMPHPGQPVIIKVAKQKKGVPLREFVKANLKEITAQDHLAAAACATHPQLAKPVCASKYVPALYFAGLVTEKRVSADVFVTVMGVAPGATLKSYLDEQNRPLTAQLYVKIERAICSLWFNGLVHGDFHMQNVLYDPATDRITVIDFGFSVLLPPPLAAQLRQAVVKGIGLGVRSLGEAWRSADRSQIGTGLQAYSNRVISTRGFPWYNPDGGALLRLYGRLSDAERRKVPGLRMAAWGYKMPPLPTRTPTPPPRHSASPKPLDTPAPVPPPPRKRGRRLSDVVNRALGALNPRRSRRVAEAACKKQGLLYDPRTDRCVEGNYLVTRSGRRAA